MRTEFVITLGSRLLTVERPWQDADAIELKQVLSVAVSPNGEVYVGQRSDPPVVVFGPDGTFKRAWGTGIVADLHLLTATPAGSLLVADRDAHQILEFDPDGILIRSIGDRHRPRFQEPFNHPTAAAAGPDGEIYVTDGYANARVHVFDPDGELVRFWGDHGQRPGQFMVPHAILVDRAGRVLVADRDNNRIQLFTRDGDFIEEWGDLWHPMDIHEDASGSFLVTEQCPRMTAFAPDGSLVGRCVPGNLYVAHGVSGDAEGNVYVAEYSPSDRIVRLAIAL